MPNAANLKSAERGQTAVEYILLIAVVMVLMSVVLRQVRLWVLAENCGPDSRQISCQLQRVYGTKDFRTFRLIR